MKTVSKKIKVEGLNEYLEKVKELVETLERAKTLADEIALSEITLSVDNDF